MIAFVHKCRAVSPIAFSNYSRRYESLFVFKEVMTYQACLKKEFRLHNVQLAIYDLRCKKFLKIINNHVMMSSWSHFKIYKNLPISNNLPSFNIIALIHREIYDFKKGTFNAASRDPRWRHWSEISHIWWLPDGQHMFTFWSDYTKIPRTHLQKVHFEEFSTCR